ncbi:serine/threonine-protein kinase [Microbacterium oxydans]|uniref:non-specific serine/threonine protein kinase n=1 Tax=Microbacterium oxydans TaxID=82380 RepID=A0A0F0LDE6_9MICO|nr:serine/threonine-protein kinase [Microbacterium oxydans]KJL30295.1 Serine/threonine-protein kinase PrkC [Microbacterium oxydans]
MPEAAFQRAGDLTGHLLDDRYALVDRLGEGGMGVVYRARDSMLGRDVAVKVFRDGATEIARTASETQLLAALNHPALVTLYDAHVDAAETRYLVMEYVDGPTLQARLDQGPLSPAATQRIARDLGEALHVVHQAGIVHRDVKPANVLLRAPGIPGAEFRAKLADFGIAYLVDTTRLTTPGTIIGSAAYLSPEQVVGGTPLPSSDIYSLGLVLLEALTGARAFAQQGMHEAVLARLSQDPVIPSSVGHQWGTLLTAMTARDPAHRPTAVDVITRVEQLDAAPRASASASASVSTATVAVPSAASAPAPTVALPPDSTTESVAAVDSSTSTTVPANRGRRWLAPLLIAAGLAVLVGGGVLLWGGGDGPDTRPALPAVEEPLAAHLQQLLDSVSP